jgi:hypothetical protein
VTALLINIFERKQEARNPFYRVVELNETVADPAVWGKNFPMQYDLYLRTVDMQRSKYGGSEAEPHSPTEADPRSVVARSKLEQDPRLLRIFAGYPFSVDYREERGHTPLYEYTWNHTTLQALKVDKDITYLQTIFPPESNVAALIASHEMFGEEVMAHAEFQRRLGRRGRSLRRHADLTPPGRPLRAARP